jgi:hypothetical protein
LPLALALAVALTWILSAGQSCAASIAFDFRGLSAEEYRRIDGLALERKLVLRLVQEGFAVVAPGSGADVELRAVRTAGGLEVRATSGASSRAVTISMAEAPSPEWQLEVAHKVSELARTIAPVKRIEARPPPAPSKPKPRPTPDRAPPDGPAALESRWEIGVGAGAIWRAGGSGLLAGVHATNAFGRLRLHLDVLGTRSRGTEIEVWEAQGSAGAGVALIEGALGLDVGLAGGAVLQRFSVTNAWASDRSGTTASPAIWAPLHVRWAASHLVIKGRTAAGLARSPAHTSQGASLWSRGALRLEAVLLVAWAF